MNAEIHNWTTEPSRRMYQYESLAQDLDRFLFNFSLEKCTSEVCRASDLTWGKETSGVKAKWKFNDKSAPNSNCEHSSAQKKLALSFCLLQSALKEGHILLLCTPELLAVFLCGRGTKGKSVFKLFLLFLSINIHLLWTQRYLLQYEESSRRTFLDRGEKEPFEGTVEGPWTVWTDCYYQREWMSFVCLCMCATQ